MCGALTVVHVSLYRLGSSDCFDQQHSLPRDGRIYVDHQRPARVLHGVVDRQGMDRWSVSRGETQLDGAETRAIGGLTCVFSLSLSSFCPISPSPERTRNKVLILSGDGSKEIREKVSERTSNKQRGQSSSRKLKSMLPGV